MKPAGNSDGAAVADHNAKTLRFATVNIGLGKATDGIEGDVPLNRHSSGHISIQVEFFDNEVEGVKTKEDFIALVDAYMVEVKTTLAHNITNLF